LVKPTLSVANKAALEHQWLNYYPSQPIFQRLQQSGRFTRVHLDLIDGQYTSQVWDDGGPDSFELELGNQVAYSVLLWQATDALEQLRAKWLAEIPPV
jgi:hypothetical protein